MKRLLFVISILLMSLGLQAQQRQISYIKDDGGYYLVYDENGRKISAVSKMTVGKVVGWGIDFFVSLDGSWYKIYDSSGKKINTLSKMSVGTVVAVSGNTFTSEDGGYLKTYDKTGKKINTRSK